MKGMVAVALGAGLIGLSGAQAADVDKYRITAEEMSACGSDAIALCSYVYPDEEKLLACMKTNRVNLSSICRPVFEAGIRRRHL